MAKAKANTELCKGCRLCVGVCPRKAIVPLTTVNKKGYEIIRIDEEACIGCGMCAAAVPEVFRVVEHVSTVLALPEPGRIFRVLDAANGCPVNAIQIKRD